MRTVLIHTVVVVGLTLTSAEARAGDFGYGQAPGSPVAVGPMAGRPVIADMNGDGKPDVVVACGTCCGSAPSPESGHVAVLISDGGGRLTLSARSRVKVGPSVRKVAVGDLNHDGRNDVVAAEHDTYNVTVLLGDGQGGLKAAPGSPIAAASGPRAHTHEIALADVNGDSHLDVLTTNANDNRISVLLGDGKARFAPAAGSPVETGRHPYDALAVADVNADGHVDLVVPLLAAGKIGVLFGDGKGAFAHAPDSKYVVGPRPGYVAVADVNNDGKPDILATHDDVGLVDVLLNDGSGKFSPAAGSPRSVSLPAWGISTADLNGDGNVDLALGSFGDGPVVALGDGKGGFTEVTGLKLSRASFPNYTAVADLNEDGRPDIVTGNYGSGDVSVFLAAGRTASSK